MDRTLLFTEYPAVITGYRALPSRHEPHRGDEAPSHPCNCHPIYPHHTIHGHPAYTTLCMDFGEPLIDYGPVPGSSVSELAFPSVVGALRPLVAVRAHVAQPVERIDIVVTRIAHAHGCDAPTLG